MIIDTHSHCYWDSLADDIDGILTAMREKNVVLAVQIGCDITTSQKAIALAKKYPENFRATVGFHPCDAMNDGSWRDFFSFSEKISDEDFENFLKKINTGLFPFVLWQVFCLYGSLYQMCFILFRL